MDSRFIEDLLGYSELTVGKVEIQEGDLHIYCSSKLAQGISPNLEQGTTVVSKRERQIQELPILNYRVILHVSVRKYKTISGTYYWEELSFVRAHSHYTKRYEAHLYQQCKGSDMSRVAQLSAIGLDTLQGIFHYYAKKNLIV